MKFLFKGRKRTSIDIPDESDIPALTKAVALIPDGIVDLPDDMPYVRRLEKRGLFERIVERAIRKAAKKATNKVIDAVLGDDK